MGEISKHIDTGQSEVSKVSQRISLKIDSKLRTKINVVENRMNYPAARAAIALPTGRTTAVRQNLQGIKISVLSFLSQQAAGN